MGALMSSRFLFIVSVWLNVIGGIMAVAWLYEAVTSGRGPISKFVAPFSIVFLLTAAFLRSRAEKRGRIEEKDGKR
jgi:hypothetical protein